MKQQEISTTRSYGTTPKQLEIVEAIRRLTSAGDGLPPTVRELSMEVGTNIADVQQKLERLKRDGVVIWRSGRARTLRVVGG